MYHYEMPQSTQDSLEAYASKGVPTGGFLRAVLENDLTEAIGRADEHNIRAIQNIVSWVYNEAPSICHGSSEKVEAWLESFRVNTAKGNEL